ncbi:MAG: RseC/MucC family positive regulator of sigma(E) [Bacteroidetes bacterium 4572_77]|nr:MAG: RseC/MucC family positive regulator of sigma(E) [Bacteroidetes bacterium 4572_77]
MSENTANQITHSGLIKQINDQKIIVSIVSMASCASCQVKGACSASDVEEKIVEVKRKKETNYKVGDIVTVVIDQSVGTWAVLFGYVFPLIVVVVALIITTNTMESEGLAGLLSVALLIPYYFGLYLSKQIMSDNFEFRLQ